MLEEQLGDHPLLHIPAIRDNPRGWQKWSAFQKNIVRNHEGVNERASSSQAEQWRSIVHQLTSMVQTEFGKFRTDLSGSVLASQSTPQDPIPSTSAPENIPSIVERRNVESVYENIIFVQFETLSIERIWGEWHEGTTQLTKPLYKLEEMRKENNEPARKNKTAIQRRREVVRFARQLALQGKQYILCFKLLCRLIASCNK